MASHTIRTIINIIDYGIDAVPRSFDMALPSTRMSAKRVSLIHDFRARNATLLLESSAMLTIVRDFARNYRGHTLMTLRADADFLAISRRRPPAKGIVKCRRQEGACHPLPYHAHVG